MHTFNVRVTNPDGTTTLIEVSAADAEDAILTVARNLSLDDLQPALELVR